MINRRRTAAIWKANAIVFLSSFCVMVIELIAGRIMAPYVGSSLYTWTSIIGVIMAGIALGNYLGGKIADRWTHPAILTAVFLAGTAFTVAMLPIIQVVNDAIWASSLPVLPGLVLRIVSIFLLPALVLSMVSPFIIKLTLRDLGQTGGVVGTIYAVSTTGSIVGTFLTGFYLISWFGTRTIVWLIAGILIASAILSWFFWTKRERWKVAAPNVAAWCLTGIVIAGCSTVFQLRDSWQENYTRETNYYAIKIIGERSSGYYLQFDRVTQSFVKVDDPEYLRFNYARTLSELVRYFSQDNPAPRVLHLGGGGYTMPRYMDAVYPGSRNDVVEIDPAVTEIAHEYLGLPLDTTIRSFNQDARSFLLRRDSTDKYDIVIGDAFNDLSAPFHLTTLEFDRLLKANMSPDGVYLINVIDDPQGGRYMLSFAATLQQCFKSVFLFGHNGDSSWTSDYLQNFIILATDRQVDMDEYVRTMTENGQKILQGTPLDSDRLNQMIAERKAVILTDDHAPVEQLIAPLFFKW